MIDATNGAVNAPRAAASERLREAAIPHGASDSEDARWCQWKQQSRADDAKFRHKVRLILLDVSGVAAVGGALWLALAR